MLLDCRAWRTEACSGRTLQRRVALRYLWVKLRRSTAIVRGGFLDFSPKTAFLPPVRAESMRWTRLRRP